jgi:hypothetical protein
MVNQPDNRFNAKLAQSFQSLVGPRPLGVRYIIRRNEFPQYRITQCFNAQCRSAIQVLDPRRVATPMHLAEVLATHTVHCAFNAAPHF